MIVFLILVQAFMLPMLAFTCYVAENDLELLVLWDYRYSAISRLISYY